MNHEQIKHDNSGIFIITNSLYLPCEKSIMQWKVLFADVIWIILSEYYSEHL